MHTHSISSFPQITGHNKKKKSTSKSSKTESTISSQEITEIIEQLKFHCHRKSTKDNYHAIWKIFNKFYVKLDVKPNEWEDRITLFVGYLISCNLKSTTIRSYVCAMKATLSKIGVILNQDRYLLTALTNACKIRNDQVHTKLPIHKELLRVILNQFNDQFATQPYLEALYKVMFSTCYYGLLHIGKISLGTHPVLAKDVHIAFNKKKLMMILHSSKMHSKADKPQIIKITSQQKNPKATEPDNLHCPYALL